MRVERISHVDSDRPMDPAIRRWAGLKWRGGSFRSTMPKVRDAIRLLKRDGWLWVRTRGSHRHYKHPEKLGTVTIAGRMSNDLAPGTWNSILKQAGLDQGESS